MKNPAEIYRRTATETSSPGNLVVMLYRGAIRFIRQAAEAIERKDIPKAHTHLIRAQSIVLELRSALSQDVGPIAQGLDSVYDYCLRRLMDANVAKDRKAALEVATLLESLLEAWESALSDAAASGVPADGHGMPWPNRGQ